LLKDSSGIRNLAQTLQVKQNILVKSAQESIKKKNNLIKNSANLRCVYVLNDRNKSFSHCFATTERGNGKERDGLNKRRRRRLYDNRKK